jgi:DnaK suppressor protein
VLRNRPSPHRGDPRRGARELTEVEKLLRTRLEEIQARLAELAKPPEAGAGIGFGKRIGDGTNEAISRRNEIGVGNSLLVTEEKLQRALAKLEEGSYGRCDRCGKPIAPGRLEAAPESALCIDCAR